MNAPQAVVYRTTSHSGSVSLAHLTPVPAAVPASSASNGKESQGAGDSSGASGNGAASGDSTALPALLASAGSATAPAYENMERPESGGEDRGTRVLGTVFEIEAQNADEPQTTATFAIPGAGDSEGLTKPLDEITAALEGEISPVESLVGQGSGGSGEALLGATARSSSGLPGPSADPAGPSPKRRHVFSALLPNISPFRSFDAGDAAMNTSSSAPGGSGTA